MEEEIRTAETGQGDVASNEEESSAEMSNNSPTKRGRGRPKGSKKLKVGVTDLMELVSGLSNGRSTQPQRGRGRPKLTKPSEQPGSGDDLADDSVQTPGSKEQASNEDSLTTEQSPKKRGRPRKSLSNSSPEKADAKDSLKGGSNTPKAKRGRPKGTTKRKAESLTRPKLRGSPNKKPKLESEEEEEEEEEEEAVSSPNSQVRRRGRPRKVEGTQKTSNGFSKKSHRGRGRPRKVIKPESDDDDDDDEDEEQQQQPAKRGRGRPKGSVNKKPPAYKVQAKVSRTRRRKRGRPSKQPAKRGRPRKHPLPSAEELKRPKVWKPLGRPRKYPRADPPEESAAASPKSRGRPRKTESKKGAHLRKNFPASSSSPPNPNVGSPRKRGRPPKSDAGMPRKLGRPKGSLNKNKARGETQLDSESKAKSDSSPLGVENEEETVEEEVEHDSETSIEHDAETSIQHDALTSIEHGDFTEESAMGQDASFEVSNQA